jgi:protease PrsW
VGGVLFGASRGGHLRVTPGVIGAYVFVSLLHGLWDSMRGIAMALATLLTAQPAVVPGMGVVVLPPPPERLVSTFVTIEITGLVIVAVVGLAYLRHLWSSAPDTALSYVTQ